MRMARLGRRSWLLITWCATAIVPPLIFTFWLPECSNQQVASCGDSALTFASQWVVSYLSMLMITCPIGLGALLVGWQEQAVRDGQNTTAHRVRLTYRALLVVWWALVIVFLLPALESAFALPSAIVMTIAGRRLPRPNASLAAGNK